MHLGRPGPVKKRRVPSMCERHNCALCSGWAEQHSGRLKPLSAVVGRGIWARFRRVASHRPRPGSQPSQVWACRRRISSIFGRRRSMWKRRSWRPRDTTCCHASCVILLCTYGGPGRQSVLVVLVARRDDAVRPHHGSSAWRLSLASNSPVRGQHEPARHVGILTGYSGSNDVSSSRCRRRSGLIPPSRKTGGGWAKLQCSPSLLQEPSPSPELSDEYWVDCYRFSA